jgi:hypothetical protein
VLDCAGTTGFLRCSVDGVLVGFCCTPEVILSPQCTEALIGECGECKQRGAMVPTFACCQALAVVAPHMPGVQLGAKPHVNAQRARQHTGAMPDSSSGPPSNAVSYSDVKSCEGVTLSDAKVCETADYISICTSGSCGESTCDCAGEHDRSVAPALQPAACTCTTENAAVHATQTRMHTHAVVGADLANRSSARADPPVTDCAGQPDDTPCRYGNVKVLGDCFNERRMPTVFRLTRRESSIPQVSRPSDDGREPARAKSATVCPQNMCARIHSACATANPCTHHGTRASAHARAREVISSPRTLLRYVRSRQLISHKMQN